MVEGGRQKCVGAGVGLSDDVGVRCAHALRDDGHQHLFALGAGEAARLPTRTTFGSVRRSDCIIVSYCMGHQLQMGAQMLLHEDLHLSC